MRKVFLSSRGWVAAHRRHKFRQAVTEGRATVLETSADGTLYQCRAEDYKSLMKAPKCNPLFFDN